MSEIQQPLVSYSILESIKGEAGIAYSTLITDHSLISRYPDVSEFVEEVHKLIALNMIEVESEITAEEGNDFRLFLTARGKLILKTLHE